MILLTKGEKGKHPRARMGEFERAMSSWGFGYTILNFPDLKLAYVPLEKMVKKVSEVVEEKGITMLVSFSPYELTFGFDHPDHNQAGEVTRLVSTGAAGRRRLWLWTSRGKPMLVKERKWYAQRYYPSQDIPGRVLKHLGESYLVIR